MTKGLKEEFLKNWEKYFPGAELPIAFFYTDDVSAVANANPGRRPRCVVFDLENVRKGAILALDVNQVKCGGGKRYLGFDQRLSPDFEYFLSCGIPGKLEGERYKKSPKLVIEMLAKLPVLDAPAKYIVFKRWDALEDEDAPLVVTFFATMDILSGLFTLANFDEADPNAVIAPFGSGCASIVYYPYLEGQSRHPRAVLGLFDISARPAISEQTLAFSVPMPKFVRMVADMPESFLTTTSWGEIRQRMAKGIVSS